MARAIVTGATGFVGANLARRLLGDGHEVHLLLRPNHNPWRIDAIRNDVHLHVVELGDEAALDHVVAAIGPEWVFHLAVHGAYSSQQGLRQMIDTNIVGTANLLAACRKVGFAAFVNTGSSSEYGFKDHAPGEEEWIEPNSYYAVTKASATLLCRHEAQSHNAHIPTLRLYSVYGPYEEPTRLLPTVIVRGLRGELPPLVNPDIARDYVDVRDVCDAYVLAATTAGQERGVVYNVGTGAQTTLREVVQVARESMGIAAEPKWGSMPNRQWDSTAWVADNSRIRGALGWNPRHDFAQGFRDMVEWFRANPNMLAFYEQQRRPPA